MPPVKKKSPEKIFPLSRSLLPTNSVDLICSPACCLKELIENSIDANATYVYVKVLGLGLEKIQVFDNGIGICVQDMPKVGKRLYTSKLVDLEPISTAKTLGFRGEALWKISQMGKVIVTSMVKDAENAAKIYVGDKKPTIDKTFAEFSIFDYGTVVSVDNLFSSASIDTDWKKDEHFEYYTEDEQSRLQNLHNELNEKRSDYFKKSLENPRYTQSNIVKTVLEQIITHPNIGFILEIDGKIVYKTYGNGLKDTIIDLFGDEFLQNCIEVDWHHEGVVLKGYLSKPKFAQKVDSLQFIAVNDRVTKEPTVYSAVYSATKQYFLSDTYPFFALNISLPHGDVNPNVSVDKLLLDFANVERVKHAVSISVKTTLFYHDNEIVRSRMHNKLYDKDYEYDFFPAYLVRKPEDRWYGKGEKYRGLQEKLGIDGETFDKNYGFLFDDVAEASILTNHTIEDFGSIVQKLLSNTDLSPAAKRHYASLETGKILGHLFAKYVVVERGNFVYLIDYDNARARFYCDYYLESTGENEPMPIGLLKQPYIFKVDDVERRYFEERKSAFEQRGFTFKPFSDIYYRLDSIPKAFGGVLDVESFCRALVQNAVSYAYFKNEITPEYMGSVCCRYLKLDEKRLLDREIKTFLQLLDARQYVSSPCGRPIMVIYTRFDFERRFGRAD